MLQEETKDLCILTRDHLLKASRLLEDFLNHTSLFRLLEEGNTENSQQDFLKECLSDLRRLSVLSEQGYERVSLVLRRATFNQEFATKILSEIVHTCVYNFYYPKNEIYEEDGRHSYTNQESIRFRQSPPVSLKILILKLAGLFENLRDELECCEKKTAPPSYLVSTTASSQ